MIDGYTFHCFTCDAPAFLIQGFCKECRPDLHDEHAGLAAAYSKAATAFQASTGKEPLQDWYGFEQFLKGLDAF